LRGREDNGFRQCKQELGWTDYRVTNFQEIEKWWEIIMSTYLMISLNTQSFLSLNSSEVTEKSTQININFASHPQWNHQSGWKNILNNFRLIIYAKRYPLGQPSLLLWLIFPWLELFPNSSLLLGLHRLIHNYESISVLASFWIISFICYYLNSESDIKGILIENNLNQQDFTLLYERSPIYVQRDRSKLLSQKQLH
jgi:hypothetical protein